MAIDWDMVLTILTAITILILVVWNGIQYRQMKRQLEIQNEQIKVNFFQDFSNRIADLFWRLPDNIYDESFSFDDMEPEKRAEAMKALRMIFDLCSEWYFLYENQYVDERFWKVFEEAGPSTFNVPAFKMAWKMMRDDPTLSKSYVRYMDSVVKD